MLTLNRILLSGYLALRKGELSFRQWVLSSLHVDDFPIDLILLKYDNELEAVDASRVLKSEFDLRNFTWPPDVRNESEYLQEFLVLQYMLKEISGAELAERCKAIDCEFSIPTKFKGIWGGICEDIESIKYPPPAYLFCLKGEDVESEISQYLYDSLIIPSKI